MACTNPTMSRYQYVADGVGADRYESQRALFWSGGERLHPTKQNHKNQVAPARDERVSCGKPIYAAMAGQRKELYSLKRAQYPIATGCFAHQSSCFVCRMFMDRRPLMETARFAYCGLFVA